MELPDGMTDGTVAQFRCWIARMARQRALHPRSAFSGHRADHEKIHEKTLEDVEGKGTYVESDGPGIGLRVRWP